MTACLETDGPRQNGPVAPVGLSQVNPGSSAGMAARPGAARSHRAGTILAQPTGSVRGMA